MATTPRKPITELQDFVGRLQRTRVNRPEMRLYRGQAGIFSLKPSLFRKADNRRHEKNVLREIIAMHPGEFRDDASLFERLVRMQHFSLPTRLLDVTFNPLVAL